MSKNRGEREKWGVREEEREKGVDKAREGREEGEGQTVHAFTFVEINYSSLELDVRGSVCACVFVNHSQR